MDWIKGEPPHRNGIEILGWWAKSKCYCVILWIEDRDCFVDSGDMSAISVPTHYAEISPPT